jgi:hypothetical protein
VETQRVRTDTNRHMYREEFGRCAQRYLEKEEGILDEREESPLKWLQRFQTHGPPSIT